MNENVKPKKIGTLTLGMSLILVGAAFMIVNFDSYEQLMFLFSFWPVILIALGSEILLFGRKNSAVAISGVSIILLVVMIGFAFFMAYMEHMLSYAIKYGYFPF